MRLLNRNLCARAAACRCVCLSVLPSFTPALGPAVRARGVCPQGWEEATEQSLGMLLKQFSGKNKDSAAALVAPRTHTRVLYLSLSHTHRMHASTCMCAHSTHVCMRTHAHNRAPRTRARTQVHRAAPLFWLARIVVLRQSIAIDRCLQWSI